ncbi:MAG: isochorismatase family protein [Planctomycetota bacterium]|jgi:nicotinamidase-related amidase/type 1 glutamine amidotransferase
MIRSLAWGVLAVCSALFARAADPVRLEVSLVHQVALAEGADRYMPVMEPQSWSADRVALIVCDVWDSHHCLNAVRRVGELAPEIDAVAKRLRAQGATIIHAPSDCMAAYQSHPCRIRARETVSSESAPESIRSWCNSIGSETSLPYPIDQSDGGEDDDIVEHAQWHAMLESLGRNPKNPWVQQTAGIEIDADKDFISESGTEIWHILKQRRIEHVLVCGVHTNMCVLGRPFGLRQLKAHGFHPVLIRDLTDAMYNPRRWPYVSHFTGTDLVIDHIERSVCQTITSDQILGGKPFRFATDRRPRWVVMIAEDEYRTERTLAEWARIHLAKDCEVRFVFEHPTRAGHFPGIGAIQDADALLVSVRRRPLASETLQSLKSFVARGGSVLGIRTSSHAFCLRDNAPSPGLEQWPEFDARVFGGNYRGHHRNDAITSVTTMQETTLAGFQPLRPSNLTTGGAIFESRGSLYKVSPVHPGTRVVWQGTIPDQPNEPVAWTFVRADSGKSFYTSLGHESDFEQPVFRALLLQAARWLTDSLAETSVDQVAAERRAYQSGHGKQK